MQLKHFSRSLQSSHLTQPAQVLVARPALNASALFSSMPEQVYHQLQDTLQIQG